MTHGMTKVSVAYVSPSLWRCWSWQYNNVITEQILDMNANHSYFEIFFFHMLVSVTEHNNCWMRNHLPLSRHNGLSCVYFNFHHLHPPLSMTEPPPPPMPATTFSYFISFTLPTPPALNLPPHSSALVGTLLFPSPSTTLPLFCSGCLAMHN